MSVGVSRVSEFVSVSQYLVSALKYSIPDEIEPIDRELYFVRLFLRAS